MSNDQYQQRQFFEESVKLNQPEIILKKSNHGKKTPITTKSSMLASMDERKQIPKTFKKG